MSANKDTIIGQDTTRQFSLMHNIESKYLPLETSSHLAEEEPISSERKIWEFNQFIICRLIALVFRQSGLRKIYRKLGIPYKGKPEEYIEMHHALVQTCAKPNSISKYVDMLLRRRFKPYKRRLEGLDQTEICGLIESSDRSVEVPLPALVWFAIRERCEGIDEIELKVLASLHVKELLALSFYHSPALPANGSPEDIEREIRKASENSNRLQEERQRAKRKIDALSAKIHSMKQERSKLNTDIAKERQQNEKLRKELETLGGKSAIGRVSELEAEVSFLTREIEGLTQELMEQNWLSTETEAINNDYPQERIEDEGSDIEYVKVDSEPLLKGRTVVLVGGKQSLEPHYRMLVEGSGGVFYRHDGKSSPRSKDEIEDMVSKADVALCPIDINSHNAVRCVRSACKSKNKPCRFLRSSSLSMIRRALTDFAEEYSSL